MNQEHLEERKNNPQPFVVWKNARSQGKKNKQKKRKQSLQYQPNMKKHRKMTIQVFDSKQSEERQSANKEKLLQFNMEEQEFNYSVEKEVELVENIYQDNPRQEQDEEKQLQNSIPFNCNQWELDKESPYLKTFSGMDHEIEQFTIDK